MLLESPLFPRLRELEFDLGVDAGSCETILDNAHRFAKLERLVIPTRAVFYGARIEALKAKLPRLELR